MKRLTFLLFCLLLGIGMANAQTTKVTGTVISAEDNEPIIGASITVHFLWMYQVLQRLW